MTRARNGERYSSVLFLRVTPLMKKWIKARAQKLRKETGNPVSDADVVRAILSEQHQKDLLTFIDHGKKRS